MSVTAPEYWTGKHCLKDGVPWFTPNAIEFLEMVLTDDMSVLEYGCGGSTVFFAERCRCVTSVDSSMRWTTMVEERLKKSDAMNVLLLPAMRDYSDAIDAGRKVNWDVISIDVSPPTLRRGILLGVANSLKTNGYLVIDNYARVRLGLDDIADLPKFSHVWLFDDEHWQGKGTAILQKE